MKCFQDRELHGQLLFLLPLTLVAVWVGFSLAPQAGYLALGLCALFGLTLVWSCLLYTSPPGSGCGETGPSVS